ncbi:DivIVA domain-containing protein [Umezawaea sp. Da 62-37]|uniref:DivIVA domain-containing protein n=1 Tax=Umezawaea sp. Da 62-37 TaxID=3075927 RepID=UPI0028F71F55|nr:DivIVA domain-containing protein [Umezawaea sp. Da 62-37]WNV82270.1 DivIVA domain-containing protein [Umezawaea sp. Da 62-37]
MPFAYQDQQALSPADVRNMKFPRHARTGHGYDVEQVNGFLRRIADALSGRIRVHPDEVRAVVFRRAATGQRGYDPRPVDDFLARAERQLRAGYVPPTGLRSGEDLLSLKLPKASNGYDRIEVDAFLGRAAAALDGRTRMTAGEVRNTRFSTTSGLRRGYRVQAVDALLDTLEQELRFRGR